MIVRRLLFSLLLATAFTSAARADGVPVGGRCTSDNQCAVGAICDNQGFCAPLRRGKRIIPFYWHMPGVPGYRYIIPLLYFSKWDETGKTQVQFPFFARTVDEKTKGTTTIIPPIGFWYTHYRGLGEGAGALPFFVWKRRGLERWLILPLFGSGYRRDGNEDLTEAVIGLLGYYRQHHDDVWRVFFPLLWDHQTKDTRTMVIPPLGVFHRDHGRSTGVIFPLVWHFSDALAGRTNLVVLPLFEYASSEHGARERFTSVLGAWLRDDRARLKQLLLFAPPIYFRRDPLRDVDVVAPFYTRWKVHDDGSSGVIAGPFFYESDARGSTASLLPIWWRFYDRQARAETQVLFPIFGFHRHPGAAGAFVGPVYGWRSENGAGGWGAGIAPIAMFGRTGEKRHALLLPIFAHWSNAAEGSSTTAVGPVFAHQVAHGGGWDAGLFPILYFGRRGATNYATLPPLFWHRGSPDDEADVVGPFYVAHGKRGWAAGLAPLLFFAHRDHQSHQVVFPIFFRFTDEKRDTDRWLAGPYFHGRTGATTVDTLFPLFYLRRTPKTAFFLSPIAGFKKTPERETVIVGLYGYRRDEKTHSRTHLLFPLGVVHDAPGYHVVVQFPFFWRVREGDETDTAVFPFYWRVRSPKLALDAVFPLLLHWKSPVASTTLFGPFYHRARTDGGRAVGLFPLFAYGKVMKDGYGTSYFGMPGAFWTKSEKAGTSALWVGPFYRATSPDGYSAGLIPLAFAWRHGTASKVVTPIYYRQADSAADYALDVLGPLYWGHEGPKRKFGLFPLLFEKWRVDDGTFTASIFPLVYFKKKKLGSVFATPVFGWSTYPMGKRVWFGPLYVRRDREVSSGAFWPIAYFSRNHVTGGRVGYLFPFYFDDRLGDGTEFAEYSPIIWRYKSIERAITIGLPTYLDINNFSESRTTTLFPLFIRHRSEVTHSTSWVFPPILTWVRHREQDDAHDVVVFPIVWRFGGKNSTTVVAPFYWDFKRGTSRTMVLFPICARWHRDDGDSTIVLNFYYRKGAGDRAGSWYADIFPIVAFGRPRKGDVEWKLIEGLLGYSRQGRNRTLTVLWLFDFALSPAPASNLTWWSNTPPSQRTMF